MELVIEKYKQTEIGLIPNDWEVKSLGKIGECIIGLTYSPNDVKDYGTLVLRSSNVQNNKLAFENNVFVKMELPERVFVKENDILICVRNGSKHLIGKSALIDKKTKGSAFGAFMAIYRTEFSKIVFYNFQSNIIQKQIDENLGATINQITNKNLASYKIPLPPTFEEQTLIATALSNTDTWITNLENLLTKKRQIKQGALQELLKPKQGWEVKKLGEVLDYEQPTPYLVSDTDYSNDFSIPVLTAGKTFLLGYTSEEFGVFNQLPTIIFDDFTTAIKYVDFPFKAKSSAMKMLILKDKKNNLKLIFELIKRIKYPLGDHKRHWIGEYQKIEIYLPNINEQTRIANILTDMDLEIEQLETKLEKAKKVKQGMMQELLTGKTRLV